MSDRTPWLILSLGLIACNTITVVPGQERETENEGIISDDVVDLCAAPLDDAGDVIDGTLDALELQDAVFCACGWRDGDWATFRECVDAYRADDLTRQCLHSSYLANSESLEAGFRCQLGIERFLADCLSEATCDRANVSACLDCASTWAAQCPDIDASDYQRYGDDYFRCLLGPESACPESAFTLTGVGDAILRGSTEDGGDDVTPTCGYCGAELCSGPSPDRTFAWTAPASGTYVFDTLGSSFDTILVLLDGCGGRELACNDDIDRDSEHYQSSIEVQVETGQTLIIVVDGWDLEERGTFVINVHRVGQRA